MCHRDSVREFSAAPLTIATIRQVVSAARAGEAAAWPVRSHGAAQFEVLVAALNVKGLAGGLYTSTLSQELAGREAIWLTTLREQYADAPTLLLICGNLSRACDAAGASGYASMLVRAGTLGYAAWLWALSAGLRCSVYGSASHRVTSAARLLDPHLRHLFTVAIGYPATARSRGTTSAGA
jgi:hypothetical protein